MPVSSTVKYIYGGVFHASIRLCTVENYQEMRGERKGETKISGWTPIEDAVIT